MFTPQYLQFEREEPSHVGWGTAAAIAGAVAGSYYGYRFFRDFKAHEIPKSTAAMEGGKQLAAVFDIDNSAFKSRWFFTPEDKFDHRRFHRWVEQTKPEPIPGTLELYKEARVRGYKIHFLTARPMSVRAGTERQLRAAGFDAWDSLYMMPSAVQDSDKGEQRLGAIAGEWKKGIRDRISRKDLIDFNVGDSASDFVGGGFRHGIQVTKQGKLARYHDPMIEGLKHGGMAEWMRKVLTAFGSGWQGLSPQGSGTSLLSNEELARNEIFYHVKRSGALTYMGKQPDIRTSEGAVVGFNKISGDLRVVNNYMSHLGDSQVIERFTPTIKQALNPTDQLTLTRRLMKLGNSKAAAGKVSGAIPRVMKAL